MRFIIVLLFMFFSLQGGDINHAIPLQGNSSYRGYLNNGEIDYYKFFSRENGKLTVYTISNIDTYGIVIMPDYTRIEADDVRNDRDFRISNIPISAGTTTYIAVKGYDDSVNGNYTLHLEFTDNGEHCNFPYHLSPAVRNNLKTCKQKWQYIYYSRQEWQWMSQIADGIEEKIFNIDRRQQIINKVTKAIEFTASIINATKAISSSDIEKIITIGVDYFTSLLKITAGNISDHNSAIENTFQLEKLIEKAILAYANGVNITTYAIQISKAVRGTSALWHAFSLNDLTKKLNSINIASEFLNELYSNGYTFSDMNRKYLGSRNGSLGRLVDAFAHAHGYYNGFFENGYYNEIIQQYIIKTVANINDLYRNNILARRNY